jgi:hypothetical protein
MIICYNPETLAITHAVHTAAPEFLEHIRDSESFIETNEWIDLDQYELKLALPGPKLVPKQSAVTMEPDIEELRRLTFDACDLYYLRRVQLKKPAYDLKLQMANVVVEQSAEPPNWMNVEAKLRAITPRELAETIIAAATEFDDQILINELERQKAKANISAATTIERLKELTNIYFEQPNNLRFF